MTDKPTFTVIDGRSDTPRQQAKKVMKARPTAATMLRCHRCGGSEVIETKTGMILKGGKASGGTKSIICANCFMGGKRVLLI